MMFNAILRQFEAALKNRYADRLSFGMFQATQTLLRCRTGAVKLHCPDCDGTLFQPRSCGHRSCPQCQNHETSQWLDRQFAKLLPVEYFMVTFTLPYELRSLAWRNQAAVYNILFDCAASTLKDFGLNPAKLGADIGMTAVLHTHSRRLDYHDRHGWWECMREAGAGVVRIAMLLALAAALISAGNSGRRSKANTSLMNLPWPRCFGRGA